MLWHQHCPSDGSLNSKCIIVNFTGTQNVCVQMYYLMLIRYKGCWVSAGIWFTTVFLYVDLLVLRQHYK